ncbi:hypothetical protein Ahy_A07g036336 [Arachis hypogaea]|uniref:Aminotransferase-like plant mobile domain-containing protein n=1 Tax=Arachis hypogaea TaxID=3818 RepID=A0A445CFX2_ARAHY|nr:hypothetical protein Ahy_A07g036336 [Arachis hypogaea]
MEGLMKYSSDMGVYGVSRRYDGWVKEIGRTDLVDRNRMDRFQDAEGAQIGPTDLCSLSTRHVCSLPWLAHRIVLNDDVHIQMYVRCHIMLLFGIILFGDKSGAAVHWKFLLLLRNFGQIIQFSWGLACLEHLYRSLCRATRVDCKEMDDPLTLLLTWTWIRLPFLAPIPGNPRVFPIANR